MRINQYVAKASGLSRRSADEAIDKARVEKNGELARKGMQVGSDDVITLDGQVLELSEGYSYLMLYKPVGYLCSHKSQGGTPRIYDLLPPELSYLNSVGRLDKDTSGLLLLSDDGDFTQRMTHPKYKKKKIYMVHLDKVVSKDHIKRLNKGVKLSDGKSVVKVLKHDKDVLRVQLTEGRNRQIRRSFEELGYKVTQLHRYKLDNYELDLLKPGEWKYLEVSN